LTEPTHTHARTHANTDGVEHTLASLVSITERRGNLRSDLRKDILEEVSSLRNYFGHTQSNLEAKTAAYKELAREAKESKEEIQRLRDTENQNETCSAIS